MLANGITFGDLSREEILNYGALAEGRGLESIWVGESWGSDSVLSSTSGGERS